MNVPDTMKAVVLTGLGGLDQLVYHEDWPTPAPADNEVLIKVAACGLNNTDVNTRSGWYSKAVSEATTGDAYATVDENDPTWGGAPIAFPRIQGADVCGTVVAAGATADQSLIGKRILTDNWLRDWSDPDNKNNTGYFGSECDGGYAEYTTIDYRNAGVVNSDLSDAELATFSCSYTTAEGMLSRAKVKKGDSVLIAGASGGVGSALIQLANRRGAFVVGLASEQKHSELEKLGADALLPRDPQNLKEALKLATKKETVSVIADVVGGPNFAPLIDCLERGGRYTCSGAIAGPMVDLDLRTLYLRDLTFSGSTVVAPHIFPDLISYIEQREIKPVLAQTYPLHELQDAQQAFIDKKHTGNIVVTMPG